MVWTFFSVCWAVFSSLTYHWRRRAGNPAKLGSWAFPIQSSLCIKMKSLRQKAYPLKIHSLRLLLLMVRPSHRSSMVTLRLSLFFFWHNRSFSLNRRALSNLACQSLWMQNLISFSEFWLTRWCQCQETTVLGLDLLFWPWSFSWKVKEKQ